MSGSFGVDIRKNYKTVFLNTSVTLHAYEVLESSIFNLKRAENKLVGFAVSDVNGRLEIQQSNGSWMPDVISSFDLNISQVGVNKCFFYNVSGSIYKDETNDINASVLNGVNLPPLNPIPGDIIYLGSYIRCNKFKLNIGTAAANISNSLFKHEYYNGSWKTVDHVLDNTSDFVNLGSNFISFDMPADIIPVSINNLPQDVGQLGSNTHVYSLAVFEGKLYGGTYSSGKVYRYDGGTTWTDVGQLGSNNRVFSLAVFEGKLYGGTEDSGKVYRYDGGTTWTDVGQLGSNNRVFSLAVFEGKLYGGTANSGKVYRYDGGTTWTDVGQLGSNTHVYSLAVFEGKLYGGTASSGKVYRYDGGTTWTDVGQLGSNNYILSLAVFEGKLYGGTDSSGKVYSVINGVAMYWFRVRNASVTAVGVAPKGTQGWLHPIVETSFEEASVGDHVRYKFYNKSNVAQRYFRGSLIGRVV